MTDLNVTQCPHVAGVDCKGVSLRSSNLVGW